MSSLSLDLYLSINVYSNYNNNNNNFLDKLDLINNFN